MLQTSQIKKNCYAIVAFTPYLHYFANIPSNVNNGLLLFGLFFCPMFSIIFYTTLNQIESRAKSKRKHGIDQVICGIFPFIVKPRNGCGFLIDFPRIFSSDTLHRH